MTPDDSIAKEKARQRLIILKSNQNTILNEVVLRYGTIGKKLNELADIMAERIDLLDPELEGLGKEDICRDLQRQLNDKGCPITDVRHYLPSKYKNQNMVRIQDISDRINAICGDFPRNLPEDCSNTELENFYELNEKAMDETDTLKSRQLKIHEKLEFIALQRGLELGGHKFRREISHKDFSENVPPELYPYIEKVEELLNNSGDIFHNLADKYHEDPPLILEEILKHTNVMTAFNFALKGHGGDYKATGDISHSMERQYVSDMHGKHAAGNSDKFPTKLCEYCSKQNTFDPDDFEIMKFDHTSPTNYRCTKCGGVDSIERGMSREQVGDRAAFIVREAQNIINSLPLFGEFLHEWVTKWIQPKEDSRKAVISQFFSDSSMSGASYKVAKKVT